MLDAHQILGLDPGAGEMDVRRRYLELVRENPPDRAPARFAEIRAAYEQLRDPVTQLEKVLFDVRSRETMHDILDGVIRRRFREVRIPLAAILNLAERL